MRTAAVRVIEVLLGGAQFLAIVRAYIAIMCVDADGLDVLLPSNGWPKMKSCDCKVHHRKVYEFYFGLLHSAPEVWGHWSKLKRYRTTGTDMNYRPRLVGLKELLAMKVSKYAKGGKGLVEKGD